MSNELAAMALKLALENERALQTLEASLDAGNLPTPDQWDRLVRTIQRLNKENQTLLKTIRGTLATENERGTLGLVQTVLTISEGMQRNEERIDKLLDTLAGKSTVNVDSGDKTIFEKEVSADQMNFGDNVGMNQDNVDQTKNSE